MKKSQQWLIVVVICAAIGGYAYWDSQRCDAASQSLKNSLQAYAVQATNQFLATGDVNTYVAKMQDVNQALAYLPKSCFSSSSVVEPANGQCDQLWSNFHQCEEQFKRCLASGQHGCSYTCFRPKCPGG